jgi:hypothetical protein
VKRFGSLSIDFRRAEAQVAELGRFLDAPGPIPEDGPSGLLRFFRDRADLLGLIGRLNLRAGSSDLVAAELDIMGYFRADFAVGDERTGEYVLIELEPADDCIFHKHGEKTKREWHSRFNHGYNQLVDWFWLLGDFEHTKTFQSIFPNFSRFIGLLVIGRDHHLSLEERQRVEWRRAKCLTDSSPILVLTYDELYDMMKTDLDLLKEIAKGGRDVG